MREPQPTDHLSRLILRLNQQYLVSYGMHDAARVVADHTRHGPVRRATDARGHRPNGRCVASNAEQKFTSEKYVG